MERLVVMTLGHCPSSVGLDEHGLVDTGEVYWNLPAAALCEHAIRAGEGHIAANGALRCLTGERTGRSPNDRFLVREPTTEHEIDWGPVNRSISEEHFQSLHRKIIRHFRSRNVYVRDMFVGAEEATRLPIRVITEYAWHNLFASQLFIRPKPGSTAGHEPKFTVISAPTCFADPKTDGTNSRAFVVLNFGKRLALIGGTQYAGEIKKSLFTVMNFLLPASGVFSMHCGANLGNQGDVALFFGLSGTGKTTLSADPDRKLIGDDEHGWSETGVFNIEGGCYAKCIRLTREAEPQIYNAIRYGAVIENVVMDETTREVDYDDDEFTENTRVAYPLEHIDNAVFPSVGGHPTNVAFLTCDAFGVLPPISRLTPEQASYHFLSGYTAKVAGTEAGITEPQVTFSTCFGAPFLPLPPERYSRMLGERLTKHKSQCWLINTGWTGGAFGTGKRMDLRYTRAMVRAALEGLLKDQPFTEDPIFGLAIPKECPGVPAEVLNSQSTWSDPKAYNVQARKLAALFVENFKSFPNAGPNVVAAGPRT